MPGWLKWKKPKLLTRQPIGPVPFDINCVCGRETNGYRSPRYQQVICLDCGEPLFVLPLNVYPSPPPTEKDDTQPKPDGSSNQTEVEIDDDISREIGLDDDLNDVVSDLRADSEFPQRLVKEKRVKEKPGKKEKQKKKPDAVPISKIKRPPKRMITPFRLTLVAIVGVLIGTVWFSIKSSRFESAQVVLHDAAKSGFEAVDEGDAYTAATEFEKAAEAADIIVPDSAQAEMLHHMQRQATVVTSLSDDSLLDILIRADEAREVEPGAWQDDLRLDDSTWLVFDSTARETIGADGDELVEVAFPLAVGEADVVMECHADPFSKLGLTTEPARLIFAAKVQRIDYRSSQPALWTVQLDPDSVVIWSSDGLFNTLGFESDESEWDRETTKLLKKQQQALGIEE